MILVSIMLWTVIFAHAVRAVAVGRADQSFDQSPLINEQPISSVIRPYDPVPHRYLVKLKDNVSDIDTYYHRESVAARQVELASQLHPAHSFFEATAAEPQKYGGITDCLNTTMNGYIGYFTDDMIDEILKSDQVDYIHQDGYLKLNGITKNVNPIGKEEQSQNNVIQIEQIYHGWHLGRISNRRSSESENAPYKFLSSSGSGVDIHILDTGVWKSSSDVEVALHSGPQVGFDNLKDNNGHGTCVASLAGGLTPGAAKMSSIFSSAVMDSAGRVKMMAAVLSVDRIITVHRMSLTDANYQGAVINFSFGGRNGKYSESEPMHNAINKAVEYGIHVVVSAGNDNEDACKHDYSSNPHAIAVGASTIFDRKTYNSNFGECVDVYAPGDRVSCASNETNDEFVILSGTSMATPIVAGIVANILSYAPHSGTKYTKGTQISPADMKTLIKRIATPPAKNQLLSTEAIAYFGGTKEELDFFYYLLVEDPTATKIKTPQFAVPPPSLTESRAILKREEEIYQLYLAQLRKQILEENESKGPSSPTSTSIL